MNWTRFLIMFLFEFIVPIAIFYTGSIYLIKIFSDGSDLLWKFYIMLFLWLPITFFYGSKLWEYLGNRILSSSVWQGKV